MKWMRLATILPLVLATAAQAGGAPEIAAPTYRIDHAFTAAFS
jgi:hypothetical protein